MKMACIQEFMKTITIFTSAYLFYLLHQCVSYNFIDSYDILSTVFSDFNHIHIIFKVAWLLNSITADGQMKPFSVKLIFYCHSKELFFI
jgi:hypothetical protein